jgi:peptide/nickel transport system substrate-binding protein
MRKLHPLHTLSVVLSAVLLVVGLSAVSGEETGSVSRGGEIRLGHVGPIRTLDPAAAVDTVTRTVLAALMDGLYEYLPDGRIYPRVASAFPEPVGPLTYRIPLRYGVTFHNGERLFAGDVVFSLRRLITEREALRRGDLFDFLEAVDEGLDHSVVIRLNRPVPNLMQYLARLECAPVNRKECVQAGRHFGKAGVVGTGPFQIASRQPGESLVLEKVPRYWLQRWEEVLAQAEALDPLDFPAPPRPTPEPEPEPEGDATPTPVAVLDVEANRLPYLDRLVFRQYAGAADLAEALRRWRITVALQLDWERLELFKSRSFLLKSTPGTRISQVYVNLDVPPLDDERVRRALSLAVDRVGVARQAFGPYAAPAVSPFPAWSFARNPAYAGQQHDLNEARLLLAEAGYSEEEPLLLELTYADRYVLEQQAVALADQLARLPVRLGLRPLPRKELFDRLYGRPPHHFASFELALEDWRDFRGGVQPEQFVAELYHSASPANKVGLDDPRLDELIDCLKTRSTLEELQAVYHDLERTVTESFSTLFLCFPHETWVRTPGVREVFWCPQGWLSLKHGWVWRKE